VSGSCEWKFTRRTSEMMRKNVALPFSWLGSTNWAASGSRSANGTWWGSHSIAVGSGGRGSSSLNGVSTGRNELAGRGCARSIGHDSTALAEPNIPRLNRRLRFMVFSRFRSSA
jgi:hypothetical protein